MIVEGTEGAIRKTAYIVADPARTSLQLLAPARDALKDDGYELIFTCADESCGGFDFRFQLDLLAEPDMHVDLGDYRYALLRKDTADLHTVALVASVSATAGFLHVTEVSKAVLTPGVAQPAPVAAPVPTGLLVEELLQTGRVVLSDLDFETGAADLSAGPYTSLALLADWLTANPSARVVLVGHTDAVGSLEANTSLSRRRAGAVADRLVENLGINRAQVQSAGAGFLAPAASNLTPEGRAANRRVEVVLLSVD